MRQKIYKNSVIVFCVDILLIVISYYFANLLRFNFSIPADILKIFFRTLPALVLIKLVCFFYFDLYRGMWRYTSIKDFFNVIKACTVSSVLIIVFIAFRHRFVGVSRSVFIIDWCLTLLFISGFRLGVRFYFESFTENGANNILDFLRQWKKSNKNTNKNLLILGAGDCGEKIYREIRDNRRMLYNTVGFLDDNPVKLHKKIHGIPVLGPIEKLAEISQAVSADEALIAIPSASADQMRRIVAICKESGIRFRTVPRMEELLNGKLSISSIRNVSYRDLLNREVIRLNRDRIGSYLKDETILVTGAAGSIGSELCRQICTFNPKRLILYEIAESPLYEIDLELKKHFSNVEILPFLSDMRDKKQLAYVFDRYCPQTVFHAAAYKHVPMLELHPWKAIENNVIGTLNVVSCAESFGVGRFILVSTDKAVRPANVMGASKRVTEMIVQHYSEKCSSRTRFMCVRFGNVLGSVGSVVPLFKRQIEEGGPVTVTDPDVVRYFMTISEACQLILQAGSMGNGGEIYILDMGEPVKIVDMAKEMIRLSGFEPDRDIKIEYIGLRPGEKLFEELIREGEGVVPSGHKKILVLKGTDGDEKFLGEHLDELIALSGCYNRKKIMSKFAEIVDGYNPCL
ncbi:MAG: polysaccharide biosynthesis protein [Deltaproteobacteria bacterium]|nr:polysaccharide biosynthesis protein [Deltaproteobacteria bacterium]